MLWGAQAESGQRASYAYGARCVSIGCKVHTAVWTTALSQLAMCSQLPLRLTN